MGAGASAAGLSALVATSTEEELKAGIAGLSADQRQKLSTVLAGLSTPAPKLSTPAPKLSDKTIVVFGGLGRQGGSVAAELLKMYPEVKLKLVTRGDPSSEAAKKGKGDSANVEVVQGDLNKPDTLEPILKDAYGVFLVTSFWPAAADGGNGATKPLDAGYELEGIKNCFEACKASGSVKHLVFSALEDSRLVPEFNTDKQFPPMDDAGRIVPHFDGKGEGMKILNEQSDIAVDFVFAGFYYGNWFGMKPVPDEGGESYSLYLPISDKPNFMYDVAETGKVVAPLFGRLPTFGTSVVPGTQEKSWPITGAIAAKFTGEELAAAFSEACLKGAPVKYVPLSIEDWIKNGIAAGMPEPVVKDFGAMFGLFQTQTYIDIREQALKDCADKGMTDFKTWLGTVKDMLYPDA